MAHFAKSAPSQAKRMTKSQESIFESELATGPIYQQFSRSDPSCSRTALKGDLPEFERLASSDPGN